jgi:8-hydroxy-5-deazaflavin:NADPH oxidoreductase
VSTAIIGVGNIGSTVARHLADGGEPVVLAARTQENAAELAGQLGALASAAPVPDAIARADAIVFAVWLDQMKELIETYSGMLGGKVLIDPANPIAPDGKGGFQRTLPDGVSAGSVIAGLVPVGAHYVKAFGTISAGSLASAANRTPERVVLFYATDDDQAAAVAERLIRAAGFQPIKVGGVDQTPRIEVFGDLHDLGGLKGRLLNADEARAAIDAAVT